MSSIFAAVAQYFRAPSFIRWKGCGWKSYRRLNNKLIDKEMDKAVEVDNFLMELCQKFPERWYAVRPVEIPFGGMAYAQALIHWEGYGSPPGTTFSYGPEELEDPYMIEFREELYQKFGIRILTSEEAEEKHLILN